LSVEVILTLEEIFLILTEDKAPRMPKIIIITSNSISVKPLLSLLAGGKYFLFFVID
jgi:predicted Rossmann-fold nucleotide-binding protein